MTGETRYYTLSIEVKVRPQDDLVHFQPNTVVASAPQLGLEWVAGSDYEALQQFFDFFVKLEPPPRMSLVEYGKSELLVRRRWGILDIVRQARGRSGYTR